MKVTLTQAQGIQAAVAKFTGINLPVRTSYELARVVMEISPHLEVYQGERQKLAKKHCELDEKGNPKTIEVAPGMGQYVFKSDEAKEVYIAGVAEIGKQEVKISLREKLSLEKFKDPNSEDETVIPWDALAGLLPIIEEPKE